ncbi:helix-turn-helix domain-containing protein [Deinococcus sp.]|uniref:AraC family transcriptional regulator n=1 Tax=Deinococcus sp. TaxID=47478 RepID=UPI003B5CB6D4
MTLAQNAAPQLQVAQQSLDAQHALPSGNKMLCSVSAGWASLMLRGYFNPPEMEELTLPATPDYHLVLVRAGQGHIESHRDGRWRGGEYRSGNLGLTAPQQATRLRWRSEQPHQTLHLHLPLSLLISVHEALGPGALPLADLPNRLHHIDPLVGAVMTDLERALALGAPDLYAESAAHLLASHLLMPGSARPHLEAAGGFPLALQRVEEFMWAHLPEAITLKQLARVAGLGTFQLLRAAKAQWRETPMRRLTRLRMESARTLLGRSGLPISDVAFQCGYSNPSHFATAFRRQTGLTPRQYQRQR